MPEPVIATVIAAFATLTAPQLTEFVKKQLNQPRISLAELHGMLQNGTQRLLALERDRDNTVSKKSDQNDPSNIYLNWKERLSKLEATASNLEPEYEQVKSKKWRHWKKRRGVRKEIRKALKELTDLGEKYQDMNLVIDKMPEKVIKESDDAVPSIAEYETLKNAFQHILDQLEDNEVKCVALYGQKGVGKTTIMQHLNNHFYRQTNEEKTVQKQTTKEQTAQKQTAKEKTVQKQQTSKENMDEKFGMVIFIRVANEEQTDAEKQADAKEQADAEKHEEDEILQKIADRLMVDKKGKREELAKSIRGIIKNKRYWLILDGIRYAAAVDRIWGKLDISNEKDSKVVLATQYPKVLESKKVDSVENLPILPQPEAWKMFQNIGGNHLPKAQAQLICDIACCGLPILIAHTAKSIKYREDPIDWETYVDEWRYWPESKVKETHQLFSILEKCYKQLQPSKRKFFLYGALHPANSEIDTDYFAECCIVQDFLENVHQATSYRGLRREGINILRHLVNVSFLVEGEEMKYVKMNDFYRQLALYISSKDQCKIYVDNEYHEEPFRSTLWEGARWVSMIDSQRDSLPEHPQFGSLQTLLLQKSLVEILPTYFRSMNNLLVLNLNGTKIKSLSCLSTLTKLKALYLKECSELKIQSDEIQSAEAIQSKGIQSLQHLQVFDIRGTKVKFVTCFENLWCLRISFLENNKGHEISQLCKLEELTIEGCNQTSNAIIVSRVTSNPWRFSLLHTLTLTNTSIVFKVAVVFPQVQNLVVQDCSGIEVLIEIAELEQNIFPKLKVLKLDNLSNMKSICSNVNLAWNSLVELHVRDCSELNSLPFNKTNAAKLRVIEGSNEWWRSLDESIRQQLGFAFSASP